jgi:hypothetical protein
MASKLDESTVDSVTDARTDELVQARVRHEKSTVEIGPEHQPGITFGGDRTHDVKT